MKREEEQEKEEIKREIREIFKINNRTKQHQQHSIKTNLYKNSIKTIDNNKKIQYYCNSKTSEGQFCDRTSETQQKGSIGYV